MLGLSITMTTLMYVYFIGQHDHDDCSLSIFFITFNLLLCFVVCGMHEEVHWAAEVHA